MNKTWKTSLLAGFAGAAVTAGLMPQAAIAAAEAAKDVIIRNTADQPVPTTVVGTTRVDATGSTVTVQGNPTAAAVPVAVTNQQQLPTTRPFQENVFVRRGTLVAGENRAGLRRFEQLAEGERLTITYWSGSSDEAITDVKLTSTCMGKSDVLHAIHTPTSPAGARGGFSAPINFEVPAGGCASIEVFWKDHLASGEPDVSYPIFVSGYITVV